MSIVEEYPLPLARELQVRLDKATHIRARKLYSGVDKECFKKPCQEYTCHRL